MRYVSTRGGMPPSSFSDILIGGLAPDGGLVVPERYPQLGTDELAAWRGYDYRELAFAVISRFVTDIDAGDLRDIINRTYTADAFGSDDITPLARLGDEDTWLLSLSNGPTLAFKDIAMQLLGNLFSYVLERRGEAINIVGATSGDTGPSAEYAMLGKPNIRVFMLSPHEKTSPFQAAQMFSLNEPNIFNLAIRGVFDDCQDLVKKINQDAAFKQRHRIGAVNSINWGRVVAQIVYYFKAYFVVTENDRQDIAMAVPSGNFGNIYAGHVARQMGLPIRRLILATNENNVLAEFFASGRYRVRPTDQVYKTSSPSMDISKASNFERFIFDAVDRKPEVVSELWEKIARDGEFDLSMTDYFEKMDRFGFVAGTSSHQDRLNTIRCVHDRFGVVVDTHTADGIKIGLAQRPRDMPLVCQETALPVKFAAAVHEAIGIVPEPPPAYQGLENKPQRFEVMDPDAESIKAFIAQHAD